MKNYAEVIDAYDKGRVYVSPFRKVRATSATYWADLSYGAGTPIANYYASTPLVQAELPYNEGIFHGGGVNKYLHKTMLQSNTASALPSEFTLCDYVSYIPFIDGDSTDEQTFTTHALPRYTDGLGIQCILVSQGSGTASANMTLKYKNQDGVSKSAVTFVDGTASAGYLPHYRSEYLQLAQGDYGIREIESVQFASSVGGIYAIVFVRPLAILQAQDTTTPTEKDYFIDSMSMQQVSKDAYLNFLCKPITASTMTVQGRLDFIW